MAKKPVKKWQLNLRPRNIISHKFDLNELALCERYDGQIDYCLKSLRLMSSGSSRLVFEYGDSVVKVAKVASGMIGNFYEADQVKICPDLFPDIIHVHQAKKERYDFIVVEKVIPFTNETINDKANISWEELFSLIVWLCRKDINDAKVRQAWLQNYNTYLRCSIKQVVELNDKFMTTQNVVSNFINNVLKYVGQFDAILRPDVVYDFKLANLGWSEKKKSIVVLDNGSDVHINSVWNTCFINKKNAKVKRLVQMIQDGKIDSKTIIDMRKSK